MLENINYVDILVFCFFLWATYALFWKKSPLQDVFDSIFQDTAKRNLLLCLIYFPIDCIPVLMIRDLHIARNAEEYLNEFLKISILEIVPQGENVMKKMNSQEEPTLHLRIPPIIHNQLINYMKSNPSRCGFSKSDIGHLLMKKLNQVFPNFSTTEPDVNPEDFPQYITQFTLARKWIVLVSSIVKTALNQLEALQQSNQLLSQAHYELMLKYAIYLQKCHTTPTDLTEALDVFVKVQDNLLVGQERKQVDGSQKETVNYVVVQYIWHHANTLAYMNQYDKAKEQYLLLLQTLSCFSLNIRKSFVICVYLKLTELTLHQHTLESLKQGFEWILTAYQLIQATHNLASTQIQLFSKKESESSCRKASGDDEKAIKIELMGDERFQCQRYQGKCLDLLCLLLGWSFLLGGKKDINNKFWLIEDDLSAKVLQILDDATLGMFPRTLYGKIWTKDDFYDSYTQTIQYCLPLAWIIGEYNVEWKLTHHLTTTTNNNQSSNDTKRTLEFTSIMINDTSLSKSYQILSQLYGFLHDTYNANNMTTSQPSISVAKMTMCNYFESIDFMKKQYKMKVKYQTIMQRFMDQKSVLMYQIQKYHGMMKEYHANVALYEFPQ